MDQANHDVSDAPLVFTIDEAAQFLRLSRAFTYQLVARGDVPSLRFGRRVVVPRVALEQLIGTAVTQAMQSGASATNNGAAD